MLACSALTPAYRQRLGRGVHQTSRSWRSLLPATCLLERHRLIAAATSPAPTLLDSPAATLELGDDVKTVDATEPIETIATTAALAVG